MIQVTAPRAAPTELLTERLALRAPRGEDAAALLEAIEESREHLWPWMDWAHQECTLSREVTDLCQAASEFAAGREFAYLIWRRDDGVLVGRAGLTANWRVPSFDAGYWLRAGMEGHGYASEAVRALTELAFTQLGAERVAIYCDVRNKRSAALAERCGFTLEARLRHDWRSADGTLTDTLIYASLRPEPPPDPPVGAAR